MKKTLSEMSLRTLVVVMVGLLAAISLGFAVAEYRESRAVFRNAALMGERNRIAGICLAAINGFIGERGGVLVGLLGQEPIAPVPREFINQRRPLVDNLIREVLTGVPQGSRGRMEDIGRLWGEVQRLRPRLDEAVAQPRTARNPALAGEWVAAADNLTGGLLGLMYDMTDYPAIEDAGFEHLNNLRVTSILFSTLIGAESSIFGANAHSGNAFAPSEMATVRLMRAQSMMLWEKLDTGLRGFGDHGTRMAIDKLRSGLFDELRPRQDAILKAAENGVFLSEDKGDSRRYVVLAMLVIGAAGELTESINTLADRYTRERIDYARGKERLAWAGIAATFLLGGMAFLVFIRRFARPLQAIQRRIDSLVRKQSGNVAAGQVDGDEFRRIDFALGLLDEAVEARLQSDAALHEHERISASILAVLPQAIIAADSVGVITMFSPGAEAMLGYSAEEMIGKQNTLLFHDRDEVVARAKELTDELGFRVEPGYPTFIAKARVTGHPDEREWTYVRKNGSRLTVLLSITVFTDTHGKSHGCGVATDITSRSQVAAEMSRLANYDPLTQLPNRRLFQDRIRMAISQARRENTCLALLMIDLDRFKPVNDRYGHSVGDLLLKAVAERIQKCLRESDTLARVGGDEFVVILPMVSGRENAVNVAEKIRLSLCAPVDLPGNFTVSIDCSIGIAMYPQHGHNEELLLKNADNAMYVAKALGRAQVHVAGGEGHDGGRLLAEHCPPQPISNLVWRRAYECGDPSIDREHKELFSHGNTLIRAVAKGRMPPDKLPEMLDELIDSVMSHFRNEEFILARYGYTEIESHAQKHQRLIERALELRSMAVAGELSLGDVVSFVTRDIVAEHMLIDDHDYFPLLRKTYSYRHDAH